ncbi:hypothetical protein M409DRAFT_58761 [Zasmidium cellare ATCC 36951]|uniref:Uncharacterized protein n=1 Tax=Zasmidium cellare ATCC 36951 TaxID=1080233 RepID=A0A6A6C4G0_ZASCE|nr:uncharacterized protein M409DRAFT_58761 [Zasmidium cellare ATCC 36951]KAF2162004.1 hypothetical protein M409DRAFT_58761 [Zasmidium cellare ATCC 36951]
MPCDTTGHSHLWPQSGPLAIKRCERYCGYCVHPRQYASTTTLRTHVISHHTVNSGSHPNVTSVSASRKPRASNFQGEPAGPDPQPPADAAQSAGPTNALVSSGRAWLVIQDVHSQLHLPVPDGLLNPIVTFLNGCGDIIWPRIAASRHHLTKDSLFLQRGYWTGRDSANTMSGPVWLTDGFMTPEVRRQWEQSNNRTEPPPDANVINSALGRLIKVYVFAMLQYSVVNPSGFLTAAGLQSTDLLGPILEVDQDEVRQGPIGAAMAVDRSGDGKTVEETVLQYREETGNRGGLP